MGIDVTKEKLFISKYNGAIKGRLYKKIFPAQRPRLCDAYVLILSGSCIYMLSDGKSFEAKEGGILYLAKGELYDMNVKSDTYDFLVANFEFDDSRQRQSAFYPLSAPAAAEQLFSRLCRTNDDVSTAGFAKKMSILYGIHTIVAESAEHIYIDSKTRAKIEKSAEHIRMNFVDSSLSVASLAEAAGFSEVYFRKLFLSRFGCTPSKYIIQTRISNAVRLMSDESLSLEKIAEESGFSSSAYFNKVFKSLIGTPPAAYRRSLMGNIDFT